MSTKEQNLKDIRILLVEDERICREALSLSLTYAGAVVSAFPAAEQAFAALRESSYDIVLTDIRLPGWDGLTLLRHIRKHNNDLPVFLITGHGSLQSAAEAVKLGAQEYILKPIIDYPKLFRSIWNAADRFRLTIRNRDLQEDLRRSEETFRALFNNASDAIFLHSLDNKKQTGTIDEANTQACARLGYTAVELREKSMLDLVSPEHRDAALIHMREGVKNGACTFETVLLTANAGKIPMDINCHVFDFQGRKVAISIARDISERRNIEKHLTDAVENERRFLGRELHDVLRQDLTSIEMLSSVMASSVRNSPASIRSDITMINQMASKALLTARNMAHGLFPVELDTESLKSALQEIALHYHRIHKVKCSVVYQDDIDIPDKSMALHLYRIAQEAVNNAVNHGKAKNVCIALLRNRKGAALTIKDDGKGILAMPDNHEGMGLHIMEYRARLIGAALNVSKNKNKGMLVECIWQ